MFIGTASISEGFGEGLARALTWSLATFGLVPRESAWNDETFARFCEVLRGSAGSARKGSARVLREFCESLARVWRELSNTITDSVAEFSPV